MTTPNSRSTSRLPLLVVLSGPSGAGKDAVRDELRSRCGGRLHFAVTATTRGPRPGEVPGVHYHFLTDDAFDHLIESGGLIEHERFIGGQYGLPRAEVEEPLASGRDVLVRTDVRGARSIKRLAPEAVLIFVRPPDLETLRRRMLLRGTETDESLARRLAIAREELAQEPAFDYSVLNDDGALSSAVDAVEAIMLAERCRIGRKPVTIADTRPRSATQT